MRPGYICIAIALSACGGGGTPNPPELWLAQNGDELHVKLQAIEPHPF
jgi:hypothetical protein